MIPYESLGKGSTAFLVMHASSHRRIYASSSQECELCMFGWIEGFDPAHSGLYRCVFGMAGKKLACTKKACLSVFAMIFQRVFLRLIAWGVDFFPYRFEWCSSDFMDGCRFGL
jgi:hypothetical protein